MSSPSKLFLIRHGQTDLNRDRRFRGHADASLNDEGKYEAVGAARVLRGEELACIYTSPISRAVETATAIAVTMNTRVETDEAFTDIDYGDWQGLTVDEVKERFGERELAAWREDPESFTFPGGESIASVRGRLEPALRRHASGQTDGGALAVVSHLAVLKICFVVLMGVDMSYFWKVGLDNGSVSLFTHTSERGFTLERWNQPPAG